MSGPAGMHYLRRWPEQGCSDPTPHAPSNRPLMAMKRGEQLDDKDKNIHPLTQLDLLYTWYFGQPGLLFVCIHSE